MDNKKRLILKFIITVVTTVSGFLLFATLVVFAYKTSIPSIPAQTFPNPLTGKSEDVLKPEQTAPPIKLFSVPDKTNFLLVGLDDTNDLTDVLMVGTFDAKTKKIEIINIPRDTYVVLDNRNPAKINAIYNRHSNHADGIAELKKEAEELLNIKINYYVIIDTAAFRDIVDVIGGEKGIYYPLDRDYYYYDPTQNLRINLKKGTEYLNGSQAEQLVRFRADYANGDMQRIEVQQDFLKELFRQVLNQENIKAKAYDYLKIVLTYVTTNFGIDDIPKYLQFIDAIKGDNINFSTLPGDSNMNLGPSYFFIDDLKTAEIINRVFYSDYLSAEEFLATSSKELKIQILNGSHTDKAASKVADKLKISGFKNIDVGTYVGEKQSKTRIKAREDGRGEDLKIFFKTPSISTDKNLASDFDIIIIIGIDEF